MKTRDEFFEILKSHGHLCIVKLLVINDMAVNLAIVSSNEIEAETQSFYIVVAYDDIFCNFVKYFPRL